jgi:hypothetical protein
MASRPHAAKPTAYTEPAFDHDGRPILATVDGEVVVNAEGEPMQARRQRRHPANGELGWRIRTWDPRTRTQPESTFWGSRDDALREMDRVGAGRAGGAPAPAHASAVTVSDWRTQFLAAYAFKVKPAKGFDGITRPYATWAKAKAVLQANLLPALGEHQKMRTVTHDMLVEAIGALQRKDGTGALAPSSKTTVASVARSFFRDAVRAGVLTASPAANLPTVWGASGTGRGLLIPSILDVERLARAMDRSWPLPRWAAGLYGPGGEGKGDILRLMAYTGLRFEELAALAASAIHLTWHTIDVKPTASESAGASTAPTAASPTPHSATSSSSPRRCPYCAASRPSASGAPNASLPGTRPGSPGPPAPSGTRAGSPASADRRTGPSRRGGCSSPAAPRAASRGTGTGARSWPKRRRPPGSTTTPTI